MQRVIVSLSAFVLLLASATAVIAQEGARDRELRHFLKQPVQFPGFDDPQTTLQEALDALEKRYNLAFDFNNNAFTDPERRGTETSQGCQSAHSQNAHESGNGT